MEFAIENENKISPVIKVIGVGGGGSNAVEYMAKDDVSSTEFHIMNTDAQALSKSQLVNTIQIGEFTRGLGAGANPEVGKHAAEESIDAINKILDGTDMVFIAAGMGGGTGTGAAPIVAKLAQKAGILTVAVVTKPFKLEGKKRMRVAEEGIAELERYVDSLIVIPNEKLREILPKSTSLLDAFAAANNVLRDAVCGVSDIITSEGEINVDFSDVETVMRGMGYAMMGIGIAQGAPDEGRATKAAQQAIESPLLEDMDFTNGAKGALVNIAAGSDISLAEYSEIGDLIQDFVSEDAEMVIGTSIDPELKDVIKVTVVATGIENTRAKEAAHNIAQKNSYAAARTAKIESAAQETVKETVKAEKETDDAKFDIYSYLNQKNNK